MSTVKKEKKVYISYIRNNEYISGKCGKCGYGVGVNSENGNPYDGFLFCTKCGNEHVGFSLTFLKAKAEADAYKEGLDKGKESVQREELTNGIGLFLEKNFNSSLSEYIRNHYDLDDMDEELEEVKTATKLSLFKKLLEKHPKKEEE